jgi:PERQ amino acid-rich with GYF domain-containing protein
MTATTMHFGPEWMRTKYQPQPPRTQTQSSEPPQPITPSPSGASTYSALVSPAPAAQSEKRDEAHPFRYSKEELLRIYKEGGGRGGLGLEVERWEGVVREVGSEPIGLRETTEAEKKVGKNRRAYILLLISATQLFAGPLNSELRRRQSSDFLSPHPSTSGGGERTRTNHNNPASVSPLRERFGSLMRRKDGTGEHSLLVYDRFLPNCCFFKINLRSRSPEDRLCPLVQDL